MRSSVFFNDTATTEIYTLSLHDALPISLQETDMSSETPEDFAAEAQRQMAEYAAVLAGYPHLVEVVGGHVAQVGYDADRDRKSTRLNSSHANISYAVFCLKKKH